MDIFDIAVASAIKKGGGGGGSGGTTNYNALTNLPKINGHTLTGNKAAGDLELVGADDELTAAQVSALLNILN